MVVLPLSASPFGVEYMGVTLVSLVHWVSYGEEPYPENLDLIEMTRSCSRSRIKL